MTGGTSGIGRRALDKMLQERQDWRVLLLARPSQRTADLEARYATSGRLEIVDADLASLQSVEDACAEVMRLASNGIDALVLNAGVQELAGDKTSHDGFELTFAVNHLAHFTIANRLIRQIQQGGRIVITASEVHDPDVFCLVGIARATWQDPLELADVRRSQIHLPAGVERGEARYSASKLLNVMHTRLLAREAPGVGVAAFNPSVVPGTDIARARNPLQRLLWKYLMGPLAPLLPGARSIERSASDLLWLATEADLAAHSGAYVDGRTLADGSAESRDASKIARMRAVSLKLIADSRARAEPDHHSAMSTRGTAARR
jgi:protochlorophyllide reductase